MRESNMKPYQKYEQSSIEKGKKGRGTTRQGDEQDDIVKKKSKVLLCIVAWKLLSQRAVSRNREAHWSEGKGKLELCSLDS